MNICLLACCEFHDSPQTVARLIQLGADINTRDENFTPLKHACNLTSGSGRTALLLLENGADHTDSGGWPLLMNAANSGYHEVVGKLIEKGADINAKNSEGLSVLTRAIFCGHDASALCLIKKGADVSTQLTPKLNNFKAEYNETPRTPFDYAILEKRYWLLQSMMKSNTFQSAQIAKGLELAMSKKDINAVMTIIELIDNKSTIPINVLKFIINEKQSHHLLSDCLKDDTEFFSVLFSTFIELNMYKEISIICSLTDNFPQECVKTLIEEMEKKVQNKGKVENLLLILSTYVRSKAFKENPELNSKLFEVVIKSGESKCIELLLDTNLADDLGVKTIELALLSNNVTNATLLILLSAFEKNKLLSLLSSKNDDDQSSHDLLTAKNIPTIDIHLESLLSNISEAESISADFVVI